MTVLGLQDSRGFFYVHTIHQFVREWCNREGTMTSEYNKWVLEYYLRYVSIISITNRMRVETECADF